MIGRVFWLCVFLLSFTAYAAEGKSKKRDFLQKVDSLNYWLAVYDTLYSSSRNYELFEESQIEIESALLEVLNNPLILNYDIETIIDGDNISIVHSEDHQLYFFSIDEKTGGSYRTNISFIHFRLPNNQVEAQHFSEYYISAVYTLDSEKKIYFTTASVTTCNTCVSMVAEIVQLDSNQYNTDLIAEYHGRFYGSEQFDFDPPTQTFNNQYLTPYKQDGIYGNPDTYGEDGEPWHRYRTTEKLQYMDGEFILIEECSSYLDPKLEE